MIEVAALTKDFVVNRNGDLKRVLDISAFKINKGEFVSLLGPSGCGKTTLLRIIAGLETATSGSIMYEGRDLAKVPVQERPFHTVFQKYALFPHLSVFENTAFALRIRGISEQEIKSRVSQTLEMVRLHDFAHRRPESLSGGQAQRVALARALVNRPVLLLLDEPFSALDGRLRFSMQSELRQLQRELGITFLMVTHDRGEAFSLSDRVAVLQEGKVLQYDSPEAIYGNPSCPEVAGISGDIFEMRVRGEGSVSGEMAEMRVRSIETGGAGLSADFKLRGRWRGVSPGKIESARIFARPEKLRLSDKALENSCPVRVVDSVFAGDKRHLVLALGEQRLRVSVPGDALIPSGDKHLCFPEEATFLSPDTMPVGVPS